MKHPENTEATTNLMDDLNQALDGNGNFRYHYAYDDKLKKEKILAVIGYIFDTIIVICMSLCFFALSANMSANLFD
jgi:hypothetical protein